MGSGLDNIPSEALSTLGPALLIREDCHIYIDDKGHIETFDIGPQSESTNDRYTTIKERLENGYFDTKLTEAKQAYQNNTPIDLPAEVKRRLTKVTAGIENDGRGIAGYCCVQLCVKALDSTLSIRLHKGSRHPQHFSWANGFSFRVLDDKYIGDELTNRGLLRTNSDGGSAMTRQLAENYPITQLFASSASGPREPWLTLVDQLERDEFNPERALVYFLKQLYEYKDGLHQQTNACLDAVTTQFGTDAGPSDALPTITSHIRSSDRAATLLELAPHALLQAAEDNNALDDSLSVLLPRTAADRKAGTMGDITLQSENRVTSVWEAKLGKSIQEGDIVALEDKLSGVTEPPDSITFLTLETPTVTQNAQRRIDSLDIDISTSTLDTFVETYADTCSAHDWLTAYVETLGKQRLDRAVVNETTRDWLTVLQTQLNDVL